MRLLQLKKLTKHTTYKINRESFYDDMLKIFETNDGNFSFQFKNEDAARDGVTSDGVTRDVVTRDVVTRDGVTRDGVTRDAFSFFFIKQLIVANFHGEPECVPLVSVDGLETIGKIITKAFITQNIFQSQI